MSEMIINVILGIVFVSCAVVGFLILWPDKGAKEKSKKNKQTEKRVEEDANDK